MTGQLFSEGFITAHVIIRNAHQAQSTSKSSSVSSIHYYRSPALSGPRPGSADPRRCPLLSDMEPPLQASPANTSQLLPNDTYSQNASSNSTEPFPEVNLLEVLGPKRSPFFLPVTLVYLLIFLTGLSGNLLTCMVIARHKKMRNPTNLYLVSLAVSDLLVLLFGMPLEIYDLWQNYPFPFGEGGCFFKTFLFETICFASILNVTALSVERYIAVLHPLKTRYLSTNQHAKRAITALWAISMVCAVPNMSLHGIYSLPGRTEESAICTVLKPLWIYNMVMQVTTVCFYLVPMMVISVLYLVMGLHLGRERQLPCWHLARNRRSSTHRKINHNVRRRQVNKMLCEFPFTNQSVMRSNSVSN